MCIRDRWLMWQQIQMFLVNQYRIRLLIRRFWHILILLNRTKMNHCDHYLPSSAFLEKGRADIVCLTPKCKARVAVLRQLANDGNFKHNAEVFRQKFGHVVVARRATNTTCQVAMQLPCEFCHKFMNKSSLWSHKRRCSAQLCDARSDSESDADEVVLESESKRNARRISAVKGGRALLNSTVFVGDEEVLGELMNRMRESTVKEVVMCDKLIRHYAVTRMEALGHKSDQKPADIQTVSQSVRTLGRFVEMARNTQPSISLDGLLTANYFDLCAITARKMSIDKEVPALN